MATYNRISPATLANFLAVIDDPQDTEAANKLAQVDLQTRRFIYDYLATKFDVTTGLLLAAVLGIPAGSIAGSTSNTGTQQQVAQGTISTPDLRALAVATAAIADAAVTSAKIATGAVDTTQLADGGVTTAKLATKAVGAGQLADGGVGTTQIADSAITTAKLADVSVTLAKLPLGSASGQLLVTGAAPYALAFQSALTQNMYLYTTTDPNTDNIVPVDTSKPALAYKLGGGRMFQYNTSTRLWE